MRTLKITTLGGAFILASGAALACGVYALPPLGIIKVSAQAIVSELVKGQVKGAPYRAFLNSLDDRASEVLGAATWESNSFKGHVTYSTPAGGSNIVYFEKECGEKAKDKAASESTGSTGGTGGGGGGSGGGGGGVNLPGGCYGNCGNVTVGELQQA